jgi:hypothetical protein
MSLNASSPIFVPSGITEFIHGNNEDLEIGAIYGDASDDDFDTVMIGGIEMMIGGYGEYEINRRIYENKYNPGEIFERYKKKSYISESVIITDILKNKPKKSDPFHIALKKLSNTINTINTKLCQIPEMTNSLWDQIGRCPCKVISFITLSKDSINDMLSEIDPRVLYKFTRSIVAYTSVYEDLSMNKHTDVYATIPEPPILELGDEIIEIDSDKSAETMETITNIHNNALDKIKIIEIYRDKIALLLDNSANLLKTVFKISN